MNLSKNIDILLLMGKRRLYLRNVAQHLRPKCNFHKKLLFSLSFAFVVLIGNLSTELLFRNYLIVFLCSAYHHSLLPTRATDLALGQAQNMPKTGELCSA